MAKQHFTTNPHSSSLSSSSLSSSSSSSLPVSSTFSPIEDATATPTTASKEKKFGEANGAKTKTPLPLDGSSVQTPLLDFNAEIDNLTIKFEGLRKLDPRCLEKELQGFQNVRTVYDLLTELDDTHRRLDSLGVISRAVSEVHSGPEGVEILMKLKEASVEYSFAAHSNHRGQATLDLSAYFPSVVGNLQSIRLNGSAAGRGSYEFNVCWLIPRLPFVRNFRGVLQAFRAQTDYVPFSSFTDRDKGGLMRFSSYNGRHIFEWRASLRDILPSLTGERKASCSIFTGPLRSLKHSIKYTYSDDQYTGGAFPTGGTLKQCSVECAVPGGDVRFTKFDGVFGFAKTLFPGLTLHTDLSAGVLFPLGPSRTSHIQDRFFLGGGSGCQAVLKGFEFRGVSPTDTAFSHKQPRKTFWKRSQQQRQSTPDGHVYDFLGGDVFWSSRASLFWTLPWSTLQGTVPRAFVFGNMGNVLDRFEARRVLSSCYQGLRCSIGCGIASPLPIGGWLELSFATPISSMPTDSIRRFQVGMRLRSSFA